MTYTAATKLLLTLICYFFLTFSYGQKPVRFALFNNSDSEIKVVTSPIIQFKEFPELVDTAFKVPKYYGDTGSVKLSGIFYQITRLDMKILQHNTNHPDTGIYILQPKSALLIGYTSSKRKELTPDDIFINYLKFFIQADTVTAKFKEVIWSLKDKEPFKWKNNLTTFNPRKSIFTYSIYIH